VFWESINKNTDGVSIRVLGLIGKQGSYYKYREIDLQKKENEREQYYSTEIPAALAVDCEEISFQ